MDCAFHTVVNAASVVRRMSEHTFNPDQLVQACAGVHWHLSPTAGADVRTLVRRAMLEGVVQELTERASRQGSKSAAKASLLLSRVADELSGLPPRDTGVMHVHTSGLLGAAAVAAGTAGAEPATTAAATPLPPAPAGTAPTASATRSAALGLRCGGFGANTRGAVAAASPNSGPQITATSSASGSRKRHRGDADGRGGEEGGGESDPGRRLPSRRLFKGINLPKEFTCRGTDALLPGRKAGSPTPMMLQQRGLAPTRPLQQILEGPAVSADSERTLSEVVGAGAQAGSEVGAQAGSGDSARAGSGRAARSGSIEAREAMGATAGAQAEV